MNYDEWVKVVSSVAEGSHSRESDFVPVTPYGADVHGSWVWTCVRQEPEVTRFASFSVTEVDEDDGLNVEVVAGLDTDRGYRKETLASYSLPAAGTLSELGPSRIAEDVKRAIRLAVSMTPENLTPREMVFPVVRHDERASLG